MAKDGDFAFNLVESIGVIAKYPTGWSKELNLVEWNGGAAKLDVRDWDPEHEHMSRGVTLREEEARTLAALITDYLGKGE